MINGTCTFPAITCHCTDCVLYMYLCHSLCFIAHIQYLYFLGKECSEESRKPHLEDTKGNASHHLTSVCVVKML